MITTGRGVRTAVDARGKCHDSDMSRPAADAHADRPVDWQRRGLLIVGVLVLLIIGYFVATAFLPRWWSHRVGGLSDGKFRWGIWWGLFFGFVFTLVPVFVLRQAVRDVSWKARGWLLVLTVLLAAPNLMTLGIVLGSGNGAHAGDRVLDDNAPGFRWATLFGVLGALAVFAAIEMFLAGHRRQKRELSTLRVEDKLRRLDE